MQTNQHYFSSFLYFPKTKLPKSQKGDKGEKPEKRKVKPMRNGVYSNSIDFELPIKRVKLWKTVDIVRRPSPPATTLLTCAKPPYLYSKVSISPKTKKNHIFPPSPPPTLSLTCAITSSPQPSPWPLLQPPLPPPATMANSLPNPSKNPLIPPH